MSKLSYNNIEHFETTFPLPSATRPTETGYIYGWGSYANYVNNNWEFIEINIPEPELDTIVAVSTCSIYSMSLDKDGRVRMWGSEYAQNIINNMPSNLEDVVAITAGYEYAAALIKGGKLRIWGLNNMSINNLIIPADLDKKNIVAISGGSYHITALIDDGSVVILCNKNYNSRINNIDQTKNNNIIAISTNQLLTAVLKADGTVYAFGDNINKQLDTGMLNNIKKISAGCYGGIALDNDNQLFLWGENDINLSNSISVKDVLFGKNIAFGIKNDNTLVSWGTNEFNLQIIPSGIKDIITVSPGSYSNVLILAKSKYITPDTNTSVSSPDIYLVTDSYQYDEWESFGILLQIILLIIIIILIIYNYNI
jgi:alpha-tubulin suppressor-like RCC1 family protein